jgi:hypothetical protein
MAVQGNGNIFRSGNSQKLNHAASEAEPGGQQIKGAEA